MGTFVSITLHSYTVIVCFGNHVLNLIYTRWPDKTRYMRCRVVYEVHVVRRGSVNGAVTRRRHFNGNHERNRDYFLRLVETWRWFCRSDRVVCRVLSSGVPLRTIERSSSVFCKAQIQPTGHNYGFFWIRTGFRIPNRNNQTCHESFLAHHPYIHLRVGRRAHYCNGGACWLGICPKFRRGRF